MAISLVVDDSKVVRTVSRRILEDLGYEVMEAEDGQDALNRCKEKIPEVILLDWNMPVMNGLEFLLAFRQFKEHADTKVIFCTTENDFAKIQQAISSGADEYVMKPFDGEIIKGKLQQLGML
jgi:two-component system chemotaxis response regulator CheY